MHDDDPYMVWYRHITCRYISHASCTFDFVICTASPERITYWHTSQAGTCSSS
ncbi:hypothetical protein CsSME_00027960 [Camellia sinensis var. sinensis]